jgi:hypothetical protein
MEWTGENVEEILKFCSSTADMVGDDLVIGTLEGDHQAIPGDWIIKGVAGEFYPCKPDIFAKTYEEVQ